MPQRLRLNHALGPGSIAVRSRPAWAIGAAPGFVGGACERSAKRLIDLMLSVPWLFLLLIGTVFLVGALTFVPALCLGPVVEHFIMNAPKHLLY